MWNPDQDDSRDFRTIWDKSRKTSKVDFLICCWVPDSLGNSGKFWSCSELWWTTMTLTQFWVPWSGPCGTNGEENFHLDFFPKLSPNSSQNKADLFPKRPDSPELVQNCSERIPNGPKSSWTSPEHSVTPMPQKHSSKSQSPGFRPFHSDLASMCPSPFRRGQRGGRRFSVQEAESRSSSCRSTNCKDPLQEKQQADPPPSGRVCGSTVKPGPVGLILEFLGRF